MAARLVLQVVFLTKSVEDDEDFRELVVRRFKRKGYQIFDTSLPSEAIEYAEKHHFDVAILDIGLPEFDGVKLFERLKKIDPDTQVMILTGQASVETALQAMKLGAYDYLTKPCKLSELEIHVERAHERVSLNKENKKLFDLDFLCRYNFLFAQKSKLPKVI